LIIISTNSVYDYLLTGSSDDDSDNAQQSGGRKRKKMTAQKKTAMKRSHTVEDGELSSDENDEKVG